MKARVTFKNEQGKLTVGTFEQVSTNRQKNAILLHFREEEPIDRILVLSTEKQIELVAINGQFALSIAPAQLVSIEYKEDRI